jgi:hypothetical protein
VFHLVADLVRKHQEEVAVLPEYALPLEEFEHPPQRAESYYLDILEGPKWIQTTEETDDPQVGIYQSWTTGWVRDA